MKQLAILWLLPWLAAACSAELPVAQNAEDGPTPITTVTPHFPDATSDAGAEADNVPGFPAGDAPIIVGVNNCYGVGPEQTVVTLTDIGGQWIEGCSAPPLAVIGPGPPDANMVLPVDTVGFEIDPTSHHFYALVPADGGYGRAAGPGSVWWANDVYPYGVLPDGGPQEYLSVTNAVLFDGGSYSQQLGGWGILYYPAHDGGIRSLTLLGYGGRYTVPLFPPEAPSAKAGAN